VARSRQGGRRSVAAGATAALEDGMGLGVAARQAVSEGDSLYGLHQGRYPAQKILEY
jgi:hypothetical protein